MTEQSSMPPQPDALEPQDSGAEMPSNGAPTSGETPAASGETPVSEGTPAVPEAGVDSPETASGEAPAAEAPEGSPVQGSPESAEAPSEGQSQPGEASGDHPADQDGDAASRVDEAKQTREQYDEFGEKVEAAAEQIDEDQQNQETDHHLEFARRRINIDRIETSNLNRVRSLYVKPSTYAAFATEVFVQSQNKLKSRDAQNLAGRRDSPVGAHDYGHPVSARSSGTG